MTGRRLRVITGGMLRGVACIALGLSAAAAPAQRLVRDIAAVMVDPPVPDRTSSLISALTSVHGLAWFTVDGDVGFDRPWVSDGSSAGTRAIAALGGAKWFVPLAPGKVVGMSGYGTLWSSDGTPAGTETLRQFVGVALSAGRIGGRVLFFANDGRHGTEPWVTDGTAAGTTLVGDLWPGTDSSVVGNEPAFATVGSRALFLANDGVHGLEPCVTDGTSAGTRLMDIRVGAGWSFSGLETARALVPAGKWIYFAADDGIHGSEPWVSDVTVEGTRLIADVNPGALSSVYFGSPQRRELAWGTQLLFQAWHAASGSEPWITDGTPAGTRRLADLSPGSSSSDPHEFFALGSRFAFTARHPLLGDELWLSDGTAQGTQLIDIRPGADSSRPIVVAMDGVLPGGNHLFQAEDDVHGRELWVTDGSRAGTRLLADLMPGRSSSPSIRQAWLIGGRAVFAAADPTSGSEPGITDGTSAGTRLLHDIHPGQGSSIDPSQFVAARAGSNLLFVADDGAHGSEPWITDGTHAGTILLRDIARRATLGSHPRTIGTLLERILFVADQPGVGIEPWISDGTERGTVLLRDLVPGPGPGPGHTPPQAGLETADHLWFAHRDAATGREPWITDGSTEGTRLLRDIAAGGTGGIEQLPWMTPVGRRMFFEADDAQHGRELWVSDGTTAGTRLVKDIRPGSAGSEIAGSRAFRPIALGDLLLLFSADDGVHGQEPWISDGTSEGTVLLRDLRAGSEHGVSGFSFPDAIAVGSRVLFVGYDAAAGYDMFVTDGTPAGTQLLADMNASFHYGMPVGRFADGRVLVAGAGIWVTDGTARGTQRVASAAFGSAAAVGDGLVFAGKDLNGSELWISDGTAPGTRMLIDLHPGPESSSPRSLVRSGKLVFFRADDAVHGSEPWVTDGTIAGTRMLADVCRGAMGSMMEPQPGFLIAAGDNGRVVFEATSLEHGAELWFSDGTIVGTHVLSDLEPGPDGSHPLYLGRAGDVLYFSCLTSRHGREPYAVDLRALAAAHSVPLGTGCAGTDGRIPRLRGTGAPRLGGSDFAATLSHARALAPASLMIGLGPGPQLLPGPCSLYLQSQQVRLHSTITNPDGHSAIVLAVPSAAELLGTKLHAQALVLDPQGAWLNLAAFSNGLTIVVGR